MSKVLMKCVKPFRYAGKQINRNDTVLIKDEDVERYTNAKIVVEFTQTVKTDAEVIEGAKWPFKDMTPKAYLDKFPDGPHAMKAMDLLALTDEEPESEVDKPDDEAPETGDDSSPLDEE